MALTIEQRRSLSMAQAKLKQSRVRVIGQRMIDRASPVGTLPPDVRVRRTFEDIGEPDTSANEGIASGYQNSAVNSQLAQEQGVSPMSGGDPLGEAIQSDAGYGFYDPAGKFALANERDHVLLKDPSTGRLSIFARDPSMDEGGMMGLARMFLGGAAGGAPTRVAGGVGAAARAAPGAAGQTVQAFDRAGVDPDLVSALQNRAVSIGANMLGNTPAGGPIASGIQRRIVQAGESVERTASSLSDVGDVATAGSRIRGGASEFIEATVPIRQNELYGKAAQLIGEAGQSTVPRTMQVLNDLESSVKSPAIREFLTDPNVSGLAQTIREGVYKGGIIFDDLRQLRSKVRSLKPSQDTKVGLDKTSINRIYTALTKDMENMALMSGGDEALSALKKADLFTYRMMGEASDLQSASAPVRVLRDLVDGKSDEQIYGTMRQWSGRGAGADVKKLELVKRAVLKTENKNAWNDFTGAFLRQMGRVKPGAVKAADTEEWSPSNFMTNYETMSPQARAIVFSDNPQLRSALDDLLTVSASLKNVQKLGNPSGSAAHGVTFGLGVAFVTAPWTTLASVAGGHVAARIMMSPHLVRAVTRAGRVALQTRNKPPARADMSWRAYIRSLAAIAGNDSEALAAMTKMAEAIRQSGRTEPEAQDSSMAMPPQAGSAPYPAQ